MSHLVYQLYPHMDKTIVPNILPNQEKSVLPAPNAGCIQSIAAAFISHAPSANIQVAKTLPADTNALVTGLLKL